MTSSPGKFARRTAAATAVVAACAGVAKAARADSNAAADCACAPTEQSISPQADSFEEAPTLPRFDRLTLALGVMGVEGEASLAGGVDFGFKLTNNTFVRLEVMKSLTRLTQLTPESVDLTSLRLRGELTVPGARDLGLQRMYVYASGGPYFEKHGDDLVMQGVSGRAGVGFGVRPLLSTVGADLRLETGWDYDVITGEPIPQVAGVLTFGLNVPDGLATRRLPPLPY